MNDWWPKLLDHVPHIDPWQSDMVRVSEIVNFQDGVHSGIRWTNSCLVPLDEIEGLQANLTSFSNDVEGTGPLPSPVKGEVIDKPNMWIHRFGEAERRYEPLVWKWTGNNITTLQPDLAFLMTYGLIPRHGPDGATHWDDPRQPATDIVIVGAPSIYEFPDASPSHVAIDRKHLQDYLSLRGMALVQTIFEMRWGATDREIEEWLGVDEQREERIGDFMVRVGRHATEASTIFAEANGARILAMPSTLPVTSDDLNTIGLHWPGIATPVTSQDARRLMSEYVYVNDTVLGFYEGKPEFSINPEVGSVSHGGQWSVGRCRRVGRNLIELELRKLYEGNRASVIRHWHQYAVAKPDPFPIGETNVGSRAKALTMGFMELGEALDQLAISKGIDLADTPTATLQRKDLDYYGWYKSRTVEPITRHIRPDITFDDFLERSISLAKLLNEGLAEKNLRKILIGLHADEEVIKGWRTLRLLDLILKLSTIADEAGLRLTTDSEQVWLRYMEVHKTLEMRPIGALFLLNELRNAKAHDASDPKAKAFKELRSLGILPAHVASGYGGALDRLYDALIETVEAARKIVLATGR